MIFQVGRFLRRGTGNPAQGDVSQGESPQPVRILFSIPRLPETDGGAPASKAPVPVAVRGSIRQNAMVARAANRRKTIALMLTSMGIVVCVFLVFNHWKPGATPVTSAPKTKKTKSADIMARKPEVLRLPEEESGPVLSFPADHNASEPSAQRTIPAHTALPHTAIIPVAGDQQLEPYQRRVKWALHTRDAQTPGGGAIQGMGGSFLPSPNPSWGTAPAQIPTGHR